MNKQYKKLMSATAVAVSMLVAGRTSAGSLNPTNGPCPTMHTLEEIYQLQVVTDQKVDGLATPKALSPATAVVSAGYYAATNLTAVDADLAAANIKTNVTIFGVAGTLCTYATGVPKTGQTTSYLAKDDGDYQTGIALPNPRFTVQADTNCVTDNLTGLVWARDANMNNAAVMNGELTWTNAISYCATLNYGGKTDWRLPNAKELYSLLDLGRSGPALPSGHPFTNVQLDYYWSSSTYATGTDNAWYVSLNDGGVGGNSSKSSPHYVWPVRGGQ